MLLRAFCLFPRTHIRHRNALSQQGRFDLLNPLLLSEGHFFFHVGSNMQHFYLKQAEVKHSLQSATINLSQSPEYLDYYLRYQIIDFCSCLLVCHKNTTGLRKNNRMFWSSGLKGYQSENQVSKLFAILGYGFQFGLGFPRGVNFFSLSCHPSYFLHVLEFKYLLCKRTPFLNFT